jgi:hypothetical protein
MSQAFPSFIYSKLTTHCTPGGCITVISLMDGNIAEIYASRMVIFLIVDNDAH